MFDFSNTKPPQEYGALIPDGTIAVVRMNIKPGGIGPGNWFTRAESGSEMLCAEFTILERRIRSPEILRESDHERCDCRRTEYG
jgi:hypothetical protein